ncbi:MSW1 (YDR268W) [Zygosaccharomyces parabailii]|nr:MSW1 (YDR268W) [Zygosaccharomyces parabailii]
MLRNCKKFQTPIRLLSTVQKIDYKLNPNDIPGDATIFSMVQPTGTFHLGNYLGATRVWEDLCALKQPQQKLLFGVADLHALTIPKPNVEEFRRFRVEAIASILASGIDPSQASVMYQSSIAQHSQLHWLLSTLASMGYLNRMTQWKSKSNIRQSTQDDADIGNVKLGLFSYPVLQAADVLIYKATHVPVGDDQSQHLELTRHLAEQFNRLYKTDYFPLPKTLLAPTRKILSLSSPERKMSKSDPDKSSLIYVNDDPDAIKKKIRRAVTDSITDRFNYDPINRPGVSNLLNIVSGIQRKPIEEVERDVAMMNNFNDLKNYVTDVIVEELREPREQFARFMEEPDYLDAVVTRGTEEAQQLAEQNYREIANIVGL